MRALVPFVCMAAWSAIVVTGCGSELTVGLGLVEDTADASSPGDVMEVVPDVVVEEVAPECTNIGDCAWMVVGACERAICNTAIGKCEATVRTDGAACDDLDEGTCDDICTGGVCAGAACDPIVTISGIVWRYDCANCQDAGATTDLYAMEPAGDITIETEFVGDQDPVSTTTSTAGCEDWWTAGGTAECGRFSLEVPRNAKLLLRAKGYDDPVEPERSYMDTLSPIFVADTHRFQPMILAEDRLVDALRAAWGVGNPPLRGMVAGIVSGYEPTSDPLFDELVGDATVTVVPEVIDAGYKLVYFDPGNPANDGLNSTAAQQPLFFATNVTPRTKWSPFVAKVEHETYLFEDTSFAVEADTLTYLPISPSGVVQNVTVRGRVWDYFAVAQTLDHGYPGQGVMVGAFGDAGTLVAETTSESDHCTPTGPTDPALCGTFEVAVPQDAPISLLASGHGGHLSTLTRIVDATPELRVDVMSVEQNVIQLFTTNWGLTLDPTKGHLMVVVAQAGGTGELDPPYGAPIGQATVAIEPPLDFLVDFRQLYFDSTDPASVGLTSTHADAGLVVAVNLPLRPFDDPYELTVGHGTMTFDPIPFSVFPDTVTFLIVRPAP